MEWVRIHSSGAFIHEYHLLDKEGDKLTLKFNSQHNSARLQYNGHQRLFLLEKTGSAVHKIIFRNEYGIEVGKLRFDKHNLSGGDIELYDKRFSYTQQDRPEKRLSIFNNSSLTPLLSCKVDLKDPGNVFFLFKDRFIENSCVLLGLCWYLFLPLSKEYKKNYNGLLAGSVAMRQLISPSV